MNNANKHADDLIDHAHDSKTVRSLALEPLAKLLGLAAWRSPQFSW